MSRKESVTLASFVVKDGKYYPSTKEVEGTFHNGFFIFQEYDLWSLCVPGFYPPIKRFRKKTYAITVAKQLDVDNVSAYVSDDQTKIVLDGIDAEGLSEIFEKYLPEYELDEIVGEPEVS